MNRELTQNFKVTVNGFDVFESHKVGPCIEKAWRLIHKYAMPPGAIDILAEDFDGEYVSLWDYWFDGTDTN